MRRFGTACTFFLMLAAILSMSVLAAGTPENPGPGDPYPEDFVYDVHGGGQFRLADFRGKKAVIITNHIVDDGSVSWHYDPFKRLKELQRQYGDRLAIAIMPEHAHHRTQTRALWEADAADVYNLLNPGDLSVLIENRGDGGPQPGLANHSLYQALNPEKLYGWWPIVLIDQNGEIAWTSKNPQTGNSEHMIYETELRPAVVRLLDPEGYSRWLSEVPQDWARQDSPWGLLEVEDFERYRDMGDLHVSSTWISRPPEGVLPATFKGELSPFPTRTGYRALVTQHFSQQSAFSFGYPYYYGFRDPGYGLWTYHGFPGQPRTGTLAFFFATFPRAAKLNSALDRGRAFVCVVEGPGGTKVRLVFGKVGGRRPPEGPENTITGDIRTNVRWNPDSFWNRLSFHVDPESGTRVYLGQTFVGEAPQLKAISGIQFEAGWACSVDDLVMIPRNVSPQELNEVIEWTDGHAVERPHVTPLEREREIRELAGQSHPRVLRVNWGSSKTYTDDQGQRWLPGQKWLRGTFGAVDGDNYAYPEDVEIQGSDSEIYRTLSYSVGRLRFTVPRGVYTLRMHFARPFYWAAEASMDLSVALEIEPDRPEPDSWGIYSPYQTAVVQEKNGIRVVDGVLDVRFVYSSPVHVAATELIQESVDPGEPDGIPDWPSVSH